MEFILSSHNKIRDHTDTIWESFVYYERCDERLKTKVEGSTRLTYTGLIRGTGSPKDRDEVNKREVCECDG